MAKNFKERVQVVRAMETIARCISDEEVFYGWLINGVADGDIQDDTQDEDLEYYTEDETFQELMECFLRRMEGAIRSGGLYCDGIVTRDEQVEKIKEGK